MLVLHESVESGPRGELVSDILWGDFYNCEQACRGYGTDIKGAQQMSYVSVAKK